MFVLPLLLAVTTFTMQDSTAPAPRARHPRRAQVVVPVAVSVAPLATAAAALESAVPTLVAAQVDLQAIDLQAPVLALAAAQLQQAVTAFPTLAVVVDVGGVGDVTPPAPWAQQDPADSLYRAARRALNGNQYARAAQLFEIGRAHV